ncbi:MAG: bifunctional phosphoribosyl-AMP cyclohydrolase/phosphoribosyl-ATP diphosphatase HisIE [Chloroflexota bacterium]|nr:bifunctional phosphoribosyl-AMP cyclohydrolase/phosphoribosyl-ATP diphosphatase HisIE [Chloroflexota bacterium]
MSAAETPLTAGPSSASACPEPTMAAGSAASESSAPAFDRAELLPAIVQDARTGQVLMLGYMNRESYARTLDEGVAWFYSRSRQRLWKKGETSGNILRVCAVKLDCDGDTILVLADPVGPTCHTGGPSCFFTTVQERTAAPSFADSADELWRTIQGRFAARPEGSYVAKLAAGGTERIAKKVGEEAVEVAIAAMKGSREELTYEVADLWFHSYVLLAQAGLSPDDVWAELDRRRK